MMTYKLEQELARCKLFINYHYFGYVHTRVYHSVHTVIRLQYRRSRLDSLRGYLIDNSNTGLLQGILTTITERPQILSKHYLFRDW